MTVDLQRQLNFQRANLNAEWKLRNMALLTKNPGLIYMKTFAPPRKLSPEELERFSDPECLHTQCDGANCGYCPCTNPDCPSRKEFNGLGVSPMMPPTSLVFALRPKATND